MLECCRDTVSVPSFAKIPQSGKTQLEGAQTHTKQSLIQTAKYQMNVFLSNMGLTAASIYLNADAL
jgi:hypothetical protein